MRLYYQWIPGAYSSLAAQKSKDSFSSQIQEVIWLETFDEVRDQIKLWW
jgi:hypothetical protein